MNLPPKFEIYITNSNEKEWLRMVCEIDGYWKQIIVNRKLFEVYPENSLSEAIRETQDYIGSL